jgi:1-acyl-sn-glycerol-3-phosphate acyltransferase
MNKKGNIISPIKIQQWEEHFKKLLVEDRKEFKAENNKQERIVTIGSPIRIDHKEVEEICKSLKNRKATGQRVETINNFNNTQKRGQEKL